MTGWNSNLKVSKKRLKRTSLKRGKPYRRTKEQKAYHDAHPICEIKNCDDAWGYPKLSMPTPHHTDSRKLRADDQDNMTSLCWDHHVGNKGVHVLGIKRFVEENGLQDDPKWKEVYERVRNR